MIQPIIGFTIVFPDRLRHQFAGLFDKIAILRELQDMVDMKIFPGIPTLIIDAFYLALPDQNQDFIHLKAQQQGHLLDGESSRQPAAVE